MFPKYRGKQVLMRDENDLEKCVACGLCSVACPADAIYLEAAGEHGNVQAGPRYASVYQIHKTRCIFCGYCEEACPVGAIFMGKDYELAVYSKDDFVWDKTDLLVPPSAARQVGWRAGRVDQPSPSLRASASRLSCPSRRPAHDDRRARRHPRRIRHRSADHDAGMRTCRSGCRSATWRSNDGEYFTPVAPLYWIKGNNEDFDVVAAADRGPVAGADAALPQQRRTASASGHGASRRSEAHSRRAGISTPASSLPASKGQRVDGAVVEAGQEPRRQAPALREGRSPRVQGADRASTSSDARGAASVLSRRARHIDAGKTVHQRDARPRCAPGCTCSVTTTSSRIRQRHGIRSIGLDMVTKSYLLIHEDTLRCERLDT